MRDIVTAVLVAVAICFAALFALPGKARSQTADVCIVLLMDASGSVDAAEWEVQAKGTADALRSRDIMERMIRGAHGRVRISAMEWSGAAVTMVPWTEITSFGEAESFALQLATYQRRQSGSTALGDALMAAGMQHMAAGDCVKRVVDVSSDGTSNAGGDPKAAVAWLMAQQIIVNAIVIQDEIGVMEFYEKTVSGFVEPSDWPIYGVSIQRKLALEISTLPPEDIYLSEPYIALEPWTFFTERDWSIRRRIEVPRISADNVNEIAGILLLLPSVLALGLCAITRS